MKIHIKKMRWYSERDRLALVTLDSKAAIIDDLYTNIPAGSVVRIYGAKIAAPFTNTNDVLSELPEQFHEAIVYKAIATGYEVPPNLNPEMAMYFKNQYEEKVRSAKKWKKTSRIGGFKQLRPRDY